MIGSRGTFHVWQFCGSCLIHLGEYLVTLDWIWSENCRSTFSWHTLDQLVTRAKNEKFEPIARLNMGKRGCVYSKLKNGS